MITTQSISLSAWCVTTQIVATFPSFLKQGVTLADEIGTEIIYIYAISRSSPQSQHCLPAFPFPFLISLENEDDGVNVGSHRLNQV